MAASNTQRDLTSLLKTSQQKAISTGALTVGLLAILVWGSLRPTINTIFETNDKYQRKTELLQTLKDQNASLTKLITDKEELKDVVNDLNLYFPNDENFALFILNLDYVAQKFEFNMDSVTFSENVSKQVETNPRYMYDSMSPVSFQVALKGNKANLYSFISYLESTPFLPKILSIGYTNPTSGEATAVDITFVVYKLNTPMN